MQPQLTYNYSTQFGEVVVVNLTHNYFKDNLLRFFDIIPTIDTLKILKVYGLVFKKTNDGFVLLSGFEERIKSTTFNGKVRLLFYLYSNDPHFINYTEIKYQNDVKLILSNDFDNGYLHQSNYVDASSVLDKDNKQIADIILTFDESHGFFGDSNVKIESLPIKYRISFDSRKIVIRYNFITSSQNGMEGFFIANEDGEEITQHFDKRNLASGREVFYYSINNLVKSKEFYDFRYYLKKQQDFFMSFELPLPHPTKNNISLDMNSREFFADVFLNLD